MSDGVRTDQSTHAASREAVFATSNRTGTCEVCGRARHWGRRFCSTSCYGEWWRAESARRRAARPRPTAEEVIAECRTKYAAIMAEHVLGGAE